MSDRTVQPALRYFGERMQIPFLYQLSLTHTEEVLDGRIRVMPAARFLGALP